MSRLRRVRLAMVLLVCSSLQLFGCQGRASPDTITIVSGSALELDPWRVADHTSLQIQRHWLYTTVLRLSPDGRPEPYLAESWEEVPVGERQDSVEFVLRLRDGVRFHDGATITARDVAATFARALEPASGFPWVDRFSSYSPRAEVLDEHTLRVRAASAPRLLHAWTVLPVLPASVLEGVTPDQLARHGAGHRSVSSGPFRLEQTRAGEEWVFRANPDWPDELGGPPRVDRIVYRARAEHSTMAVEVLTGEADMYFPVAPDLIDRLASADGVRVVDLGSRDWTFIAWNTRIPILADQALRNALGLAIDRERLVGAVSGGHGVPGSGVLPPAHPAFESGRSPAANPAEAAARFDALGWHAGPDGIRRDSTGRPLRIELLVNSGSAPQRALAEAVQYQLRQVGVDLRIRVLELGTLLDHLTRALPDGSRRFEAALLTWSDPVPKDDRPLFHSQASGGRWGISGVAHAGIDALLDTVARLTGESEDPGSWRRYRDSVSEVEPVTVLLYPPITAAVSRRLRGVDGNVRGELAGAASWWVVP